MVFLELVTNRETREKPDPALNLSGKLTKATRGRGIIVRPVNDGIAIAPPLTIQQPELDTIADAINEAVREVLG
jgi:adenosylmethionine-8-amino-7-oxononanoate aminotransferase